MNSSLVILTTLLIIVPAMAVDAKNFKRCDQSGFCKRHRALWDERAVSPYHIAPSSIQIDTNKGVITGMIQDALSFSISTVKGIDSSFRWTVKELQPLYPRYSPDSLIIGEDIGDRSDETHVLVVDEHTDAQLVAHSGNAKVFITFSPMSFSFSYNDMPTLSLNADGLFEYEPYRTKPEDETQVADESAKGMWEETFNNHKDSKPRGPASFGCDIQFHQARHVYGIPEHATSMALKPTRGHGEPYRLYNLDVFEYEMDSPAALYGSIPFMMSHHAGQSAGVFWMNPSETFVDVAQIDHGTKTHWMSESGLMDVFVFLGPTSKDVLSQYTALTGRPYFPPIFSLGYHQCRWNYRNETDVKEVDHGFDQHNIPYDTLWLDIEHTDDKKYFTWDQHVFPNPEAMQQDLASRGRRMVTIVDPHVKRAPGYSVHDYASSQGLYVKKPDGTTDFDGHCWPGSSSWYDFLSPEARRVWANNYVEYPGATSVLHTWNDMNEPSCFNGPEITFPKDLVHYESVEHRDVHNIYGMLQVQSSIEGMSRRFGGNIRPFSLSRAFFAGSQRFGFIWTGDNAAEWSHLEAAQPMLLSIGLSGLPLIGADVGGFFGNPTPELLVRWYQAGAFQPFFRGHAHIDTERREPWLFGDQVTDQIRNAIHWRYRMLNHIYTLAYQSSQTGVPIMRPLWMEFPQDELTFDLDSQFMLGDALLVCPVTKADTSTLRVYLPGEAPWYSLYDGALFKGASTLELPVSPHAIPVFQRGGTIVPRRERLRRSSSSMNQDPFTLIVALDSKQSAQGELYLDDGISFDYKSNAFIRREFDFVDGKLINHPHALSPLNGRLNISIAIERIVIWGVHSKPSSVTLNGKALTFVWNEQELVLRQPGVTINDNWEIVLTE